jgi:allantoin racemase
MVRVAFIIGQYPGAEQDRRADVARSYSRPGLEVGVIHVGVTPYVYGLTPADIEEVSPAFIAAYRQAEREGYDAAVPLGVLDLGVDGGRSAVDIPILGPCESILHVASQLGDRFGCIVYDELNIAYSRPLVRRYEMEDKIVGWRSSKFDLPDFAANHDKVVENFLAAARSLIDDDGADVILPLGVSQCPVHMKPDWLMKELGVPVVDGFGAPIMMAQLLVNLGLRHSRKRWAKQGAGKPT